MRPPSIIPFRRVFGREKGSRLLKLSGRHQVSADPIGTSRRNTMALALHVLSEGLPPVGSAKREESQRGFERHWQLFIY